MARDNNNKAAKASKASKASKTSKASKAAAPKHQTVVLEPGAPDLMRRVAAAEAMPAPVVMLLANRGCPYCQMLRPAWSEARPRLLRNANVVEVETDVLPMLRGAAGSQPGARLMGVIHRPDAQFNGVPHIVHLAPRVSVFDGPRDAASIAAWADRCGSLVTR